MSRCNEQEVFDAALALGRRLQALGAMVATVESCTGGLIARALTEIAGSSVWFERGFVTYSNEAKAESVGVRPQTIQTQGAVSEATAAEMAAGALAHSRAMLALSVTGIAGPGGAVPGKPVGTVCFGWALSRPLAARVALQIPDSAASALAVDPAAPGCAAAQPWVRTGTHHFEGDRAAVRCQAALLALEQALNLLSGQPKD